jgi:hypothetical protein
MNFDSARLAVLRPSAGTLPGPNVVLSDEVRNRTSESMKHLIEDAGFATRLFDATVRKMRCKRGALWPGDDRQK